MTCARRHSISHYCTWKRIFLIPLIFLLSSCMDATPPIIKAVESGSLEEVQKAIRYNADLNALDEEGMTALMIAVRGVRTRLPNGQIHLTSLDTRIAKALIEAGADLDTSKKNTTVLDLAILRNEPDLVELLLEKGAPLTTFDNSSLKHSIYCGNLDIFDLIFKKTIKTNPSVSWQPIMYTAAGIKKNTVEIMTKLLDRGASVKGCFYIAAEHGNMEGVKFLLQHGADLNETNFNGVTGLFLAAKRGHLETVKYLLEQGADLSKGKYQFDALLLAEERGYHEIVDILFDYGINTSGALFIVEKTGHAHVMRKLLKRGADTNETNPDGYTPLTFAAVHGGLYEVQILIEHGADVNHPDKNGKTALQYAQECEDEEMIKLLKNAGAKE